MKVAITGGTGLIGTQLTKDLLDGNHEPIILTRNPEGARGVTPALHVREWNPNSGEKNHHTFEDADAVVSLAGEPIYSGRWNESKKKRIRDSRVNGIQRIIEVLDRMDRKPEVLICGSAVGYYGSRGNDRLKETEGPGNDFLAQVCLAQEKATDAAVSLGIRVVKLRTGIVLSASGGALNKLLPPFRLGLGGRLGNGKQWFPWIHEKDISGIILHTLENRAVSGPVNASSPGILSNRDFTKILAQTLGKPALFAAPPFALRMIFGEMSTILFSSIRPSTDKILGLGYLFKFREIDAALRDCIKKGGNPNSTSPPGTCDQ